MPRPGEDRSDVGGAAQFNNIGPVPLSPAAAFPRARFPRAPLSPAPAFPRARFPPPAFPRAAFPAPAFPRRPAFPRAMGPSEEAHSTGKCARSV